jgi:hypothetical protein
MTWRLSQRPRSLKLFPGTRSSAFGPERPRFTRRPAVADVPLRCMPMTATHGSRPGVPTAPDTNEDRFAPSFRIGSDHTFDGITNRLSPETIAAAGCWAARACRGRCPYWRCNQITPSTRWRRTERWRHTVVQPGHSPETQADRMAAPPRTRFSPTHSPRATRRPEDQDGPGPDRRGPGSRRQVPPVAATQWPPVT